MEDVSYVFYGDQFKQYSFYVLATEKQGNQEKQKTIAEATVYFDTQLGVVSNTLGTPIMASPYPMEESFLLKFGESLDNVEVLITKIYGQTMYHEKFSSTD